MTWGDIDFDAGTVRVVAKPDTDGVEAWGPKDFEARTVSVPAPTIDLLSCIHADAVAGGRFIFLSPERVAWMRAKREAGTWSEGQSVINNLSRDFRRLADVAGSPMPRCMTYGVAR